MEERTQYFSAWAQQRARYSRARRGRNERGASLVECALVEGAARALAQRAARAAQASGDFAAPAALPAA